MSERIEETEQDGISEIREGLFVAQGDTTYQIESVDEDEIRVSELGDRWVDECPVAEDDECIRPGCDGKIGEFEADEETMTAHELFCYECGLHWTRRGSHWEEGYSDFYTSFSYEE